jgi:hypothetical protein
MATHFEPDRLDLEEQIIRIRAMVQESEKRQLEMSKIVDEQIKVRDEIQYMPRVLIFQAMLATAALLGAGAAIAKLIFP